MSGVDFSPLDVPREHPIGDPIAYLHAAIAWHFGEDTGSRVLVANRGDAELRSALTDIETFDDLRKFPNLVDRIAKCPSRRPDTARVRVAAAHSADLRIRRHHRGAEADRSTAGLGRAGHPMAGRGLRRQAVSCAAAGWCA